MNTLSKKELQKQEDTDDIEEELSQENNSLLSSDHEDSDQEAEQNLPNIAKLPALSQEKNIRPQDTLNVYLREINKFPTLDPEEEFRLARRIREDNDQEAAFQLVTSHLRLVVKIAMEFQRRWMKNILELIQEGNIGLMKAIQKFNPDRGIKFSYYASFWIKAYILKFIMDNWRMVKIGTTQSQRKLFYNLGKEKQRLENLGFTPDAETLSQNLDVSEDEITEMNLRMGQHDLSLDSPYGEDSTTTHLDMLPALETSVEDRLAQEEMSESIRQHLKAIVPQLNDKEKDILYSRLLASSPITLREIGDKYNITRERVRQIESRLLQKIRKHLTSEIQDFSSDWISDG
jgi:RNA polymerase sigma-32 factor